MDSPFRSISWNACRNTQCQHPDNRSSHNDGETEYRPFRDNVGTDKLYPSPHNTRTSLGQACGYLWAKEIIRLWAGCVHSRFIALRLSLIHISEPTRLGMISYAVFCLKK